MPRPATIRLIVVLPLLLTAAVSTRLAAQDDLNSDPNDAPLGDLARSLRKKTPPSQSVIDDDNLSKVMEQAENRHAPGSAFRFLMAGESKEFRVSAPDVSCSLAFTANVKALLSNQYAQMELPAGELSKLDGPATIEGDALIVAVDNRTDWHVSEIAVALTVIKKTDVRNGLLPIGGMEEEVRPEKKPDVTTLYRMRAAAAPTETAVFSAPLKVQPASDEEWHWAIVQARGYPPQSYAGPVPPTEAEPNEPARVQAISDPSTSSKPTLSPAVAEPQNTPRISLGKNPH
jgi:hypothetical protein